MKPAFYSKSLTITPNDVILHWPLRDAMTTQPFVSTESCTGFHVHNRVTPLCLGKPDGNHSGTHCLKSQRQLEHHMTVRSAAAMRLELQEAKDVCKTWSNIARQAAYVSKIHTQSLFKALGKNFEQMLLYIYALTLDLDMCEWYSVYASCNWSGISPLTDVNPAEIKAFLDYYATPGRIDYCKQNVESKFHVRAARWLAEWEVILDLCCMNAKGVSPPGHHLMSIFIKSFAEESQGPKSIQFLSQLQLHKWARDKWLAALRRNWLLTFRTMPARPPLTPSDIVNKAWRATRNSSFFENLHLFLNTRFGFTFCLVFFMFMFKLYHDLKPFLFFIEAQNWFHFSVFFPSIVFQTGQFIFPVAAVDFQSHWGRS